MILTLNNLDAGLRWWRKNWAKWPDLLNSEYHEIYNAKAFGLTDVWWDKTLDRLSKWRALRPISKSEMHKRGKDALPKISKAYQRLVAKTKREPSILVLRWEDLEPLFVLASGLKSNSVVFASKLCHFIFPMCFFPVDTKATGLCCDYESHWRGMKAQWAQWKDKKKAMTRIRQTIQASKMRGIHHLYPRETKIMELCQIGRRALQTVTERR